VQGDRVGAARALVQAVHVLRDEREPARVALLKGRQRPVPRIGRHLGDHVAAELVPIPHATRVGAKRLLGGQVFGFEPRPQAGLGIAERGHAGFGTHARTGQHGDVACAPDPVAHRGHVQPR
jgi:hypothetical protein